MVREVAVESRQESREQRFRRLAERWRVESRHVSNTAQMALLGSYQGIIDMGEDAVPLILAELRREPDTGSGRSK